MAAAHMLAGFAQRVFVDSETDDTLTRAFLGIIPVGI